MLDFPVWKRIWVWALTLIVAACALPTLVTQLGGTWPSALPSPQVNLGLDLAGGSQLLLEAQPADVAKQRLETMEETVRTAMRSAQPRIQIGDLSTAGGRLSFLLEEESYRVTTASSIAEAMLLTEHFACTVLDHHAVRDAEPADIAAFTQRHRPVVTLTNGLEGAGTSGSFRVVTKPFLGPALSQAVRDAVTLGH